MNKHPVAEIEMEDGAWIILELYPERTPNTVASFIWASSRGFYDGFSIQRIGPGVVIDVSYNGLGREECKYCIENESPIRGFVNDFPVELGSLCMGGYDDNHISGCEWFFPLQRIERWQDRFPVFGRVIYGLENILQLGAVELCPTIYQPVPRYTTQEPKYPQRIKQIRIDCKGRLYPEPRRMEDGFFPSNWK